MIARLAIRTRMQACCVLTQRPLTSIVLLFIYSTTAHTWTHATHGSYGENEMSMKHVDGTATIDIPLNLQHRAQSISPTESINDGGEADTDATDGAAVFGPEQLVNFEAPQADGMLCAWVGVHVWVSTYVWVRTCMCVDSHWCRLLCVAVRRAQLLTHCCACFFFSFLSSFSFFIGPVCCVLGCSQKCQWIIVTLHTQPILHTSI